jgi:predicted  nucleic acid-binding Zn-ribbon protein
VADREQIVRDLRDQLETAQERRRKAASDLESVTETAGHSGSSPEDLQRLLEATREYSAADAEVTNALLRLNYVLDLPSQRSPHPYNLQTITK